MTLIEIMLVVVIMALITTAVGMGVMHAKGQADVNLARTGVRTVASAVEAYMIEHRGKCPTLAQLVESGTLKRGTEPRDPWGNEYRIECEDSDVNVLSPGKDPDEPSDDISVF
jgi:general secretion pathway protein G